MTREGFFLLKLSLRSKLVSSRAPSVQKNYFIMKINPVANAIGFFIACTEFRLYSPSYRLLPTSYFFYIIPRKNFL